jgi:hypothetical protein
MKIFDTRNDFIKTLNKDLIICEIGVFKGEFSKFIFDEINPKELHLIDIFEGMMCSGDKDGNDVVWVNLNDEIELIKNIPNIYYKDVTASTVIDKCRSWTLPDNMAMLYKYVDNKPKVIVLERPILDIVKSFVNLRKENNWQGNLEEGLLDDWSEPIVRSLNGVKWAKANNNGEFFFIQYDDLLHDTNSTIDKIYEFCELESFKHDFNNIVNKHPENDEVYGMLGQHDVRPTISKRNIDIKLSSSIVKKCKQLDQ